MMLRVATPSVMVAALSVAMLGGCAQGAMSVSPGTILETVIAVGGAVSRASSGSTTSGSTSTSSARRRMPDSPAPTAMASHVLRAGEQFLGVPYTWGGSTPQSGFDCSGFTKYVFAHEGIALPRTSREQSRAGSPVSPDFSKLVPGDLMLFAEPGEAISHVAIYAGNGRILHSSSSVGGVGYTDLNAGGDWFIQNLVAARRLQ